MPEARKLHRIFSPMRQRTCELCHCCVHAGSEASFRVVVWAEAANGDILFIGATGDAHVSIRVNTGDSEWSFRRGREFRFGFALVFLLYDEDFVADYVVVRNACLIFLLVVGDGLVAALQFQKLPVDFHLLSENHVHAKRELTRIER